MKKSLMKKSHLSSECNGVPGAKKEYDISKNGIKMMSFLGFLPLLMAEDAGGGNPLVALFVIVGIVVVAFIGLFVMIQVRAKRGYYDEKPEPKEEAAPQAEGEQPAEGEEVPVEGEEQPAEGVEEVPAEQPEEVVAEEPAPVEESKQEAIPVAAMVDDLVPEEGMEIVESKVNDDGDIVLVEKDAKGNIFEIRFIKSFTAKLSQAEDTTKDYYTELKNYVLAYKKANSRVSWHYDAVNVGRNMALKFAVRGKTLCVYYDLKGEELDPKYKVEEAKGKKYEDVPVLYRIKNDRRCGYAKELIDMVMAKLGLEKGEVPAEDYRIPYEDTMALLKKGLVKELKVRVNKPVEEPAPAPVEEPKEEVAEQSYEELAKEEGMEIVESKVNDDGDVVLVEKDAKGNIFEIRFIKSFTAKLSQAEDVMKDYYTILKNYVLAHKRANSRVSWHYDAVNVGRDMVIKFAVRGKTLCVYYDLKVDELDPKYKVEPAKGKKYEDVPCLYRIKNDRRCEYAKGLIDMVMGKVGAEKGEVPNEDYRIPYEETIPLLKKGLIKEQKIRVNKPEAAEEPAPAPAEEPAPEPAPVEEAAPVEEVYRELAKEEGMEIVESKVNNDGDIVLVEKDAKGNLFEIRFIKSFTAKLSQSEDVVKDYYTGLKNYVLAYKKANSRVSWHYDAVNVGREIVIKFAIRGKTLCLYYALAKDGLDPKYKVEDAKGKKFEDVPVLYRIKNDRRYNYAKDLIDMVMGNVGAEKGEEPNVDYRIPYEETTPLLKRGLIKELKVRVKDQNEPAPEPAPEPEQEPARVEEPVEEEKPVEEVHQIEIPAHLEHVSVQEADEMMSDEVAEEVIVIKKSKVKHMGKKEVINLDMLSKYFNDGDVVDLESLKEKKLINAKTDYIKVLARGVLDKKLTVKADDFSLQAVKMIALMGGTVKEYK